MSLVLVDTSSWIEALRNDGDEGTRARVKQLMLEGRAAWCDIVLLELYNGARGRREREALRRYEHEIDNLETNRQVWNLAYDIARRCRSHRVNVPATDVLIAACAHHHRVAIEHRDSDFELIAAHVR